MQALKLIIQGAYYDSQIYSGRLYLWKKDGSIVTVHWDRLVDSIEVEPRLRLALSCAFQQSEYLYGERFKLIIQDEEVRAVLKKKFEDLAKLDISLSEADLRRRELVLKEQNNLSPFPHADTTIYNRTLYVGAPSGITALAFNPRDKMLSRYQPEKFWDGPVLSISASYMTLAIAAGNEGLYEYPLSDAYNPPSSEPYRLIAHHSSAARWLYSSVFSSSYTDGGYLADFTLEREIEIRAKDPEIYWEDEDEPVFTELSSNRRKLREIVPSDMIFGNQWNNGHTAYTWGAHDKICLASREGVEVVQYSPYKGADSRFASLGRIHSDKLTGDIVSGDSALFGFILELDDGLLIIDSDAESSLWLPGEPVNWRVFPKSKFYTNQLHIVYEDHICIYSFNQDYFVDQEKKRAGLRHARLPLSGFTRIPVF